MTVESTIARANAEIVNGRLWRAKEILSSSLSTYGYSPNIYLAYANLLLQAGDDLAAGKYYLLSVDEPDEAQKRAIDLFLTRHQKDDWRQLFSSFPKPAQIQKRDEYPTYLRSHLMSRQAPELLYQAPLAPSVWTTWVLPAGCLAAALGTALCALVGAYTLLLWLSGRL